MNGTVRFPGRVLMIVALAAALTAVLTLGSSCSKHPASHAHAAQAASGGGCCAAAEEVAPAGPASVCTRNDSCPALAEQMPGHGQAWVYEPNDKHTPAAEQTPVSAASDTPTPVAKQTVGREQEQVSAQTTAVAEQTICAVMGGTINKAIFVEYQGKKVYFCCGGCPDVFKADPQKYVSKLPQFQNSL